MDKGAAIAAAASGAIPGKAGQVAGDVAQTTGVVTAIVQQIQAKSGSEVPPEEAQKQATLATAVAVDDHEDRLKQLESILKGLQAVAGAAQGSQAGQGTQTGGGSEAGQGTQAGGGSAAGQGTQAGGGTQAGQGTQT